MRVLLVEDDDTIAAALAETLSRHRYQVSIAKDGLRGLSLAEAYDFDLMVLDVIVPGLDGISLCQQLRSQGQQMPILLLTARDSSGDRVRGLDAGADDYLIKPFDMEELLARIRALSRRQQATLPPLLYWGTLTLNSAQGQLWCGQTPVHLTPKEYALLELFLTNPQRVFSRSAILERLWNTDEFPGEETVTTHIKSIRQRLKAAGLQGNAIDTVYGLGYRLGTPIDALPSNSSSTINPLEIEPLPPPPPSEAPLERASQGAAILRRLWDKFQPTFETQMTTLEQVTATWQEGQLTPEQRHQGRQNAHKMAGSLGTFGLPDGSLLARQIETALEEDDRPYCSPQFMGWVGLLRQELSQSPTLAAPQPASPPTPAASDRPHPLQRRVLLVDDDEVWTEHLRHMATLWNWDVTIAPTPAIASQRLSQALPDVMLLDLSFPQGHEDGLTLLHQVTQQYPALPVLVLTGRTTLSDRVAVARQGGRAFLQKPIALDTLLHSVDQVLQPQHTEAQILVVDDDPTVLSTLKAFMAPWGMVVTSLSDPTQFWDTLSVSRPHLLILDDEMPEFNGLELCQVVRNDPRWSSLPILVLSTHTDLETIQRIYTSGADDYVQKPVLEPVLIARVLNRLERVRTLQKLADKGAQHDLGA